MGIWNLNAVYDGRSAPMVTQGLVLYLDAAKYASYPGTGSTWSDLSGSGYNGTLNNSPTFSTDNGGYFTFNGSNTYVDLTGTTGLNIATTSNISISAWLYPTLSTGWRGIVTKNRSTSTHAGMWLNGLIPVFGSATNGNLEATSNPLTVNTWNNVVITQTASTNRKVYLNNSLVATAATAGASSGTESVRIGMSTGVSEYFGGRIAQVLYYNKTLTDAEIVQNFYAFKERFGL